MLEPDWNQEQLTTREILDFWKGNSVFERTEVKEKGIHRVLSAFRESHVNGDAEFQIFSFPLHQSHIISFLETGMTK